MDRIAKTAFRPIYPVIAQNAMEATGVRQGKMPGPWHRSWNAWPWLWPKPPPEMPVTAFDFSDDSLEIARENIREGRS